MSEHFFENMQPEFMHEILNIFYAEHALLVFVSFELMVLRQTDAAASLLGSGSFYSVEGILSRGACSAIKLCMEHHTSQTITERLDNTLYKIAIHPMDNNGALLSFSRVEDRKDSYRMLSIQQNQKMRDSLSLILMAASNMKRQPLNERGHTYIAIVRQNSLRLLRSLEHEGALRDSATAGEANLCLSDLSTLCRGITAEIRQCLQDSSAELSLDCPETLPAVFDPERLSLALYNLLSNAFKYGGAEVTVILKAERKDKSIYLSVADNGPGMSDEALHWACDGYRQAVPSDSPHTPPSSCWGMGIPLARKIAALHAGVLFISSGTGVGTTVTIAFPDNLSSDKSFSQTESTFSSGGFHMADIELSTVLDFDHYKL